MKALTLEDLAHIQLGATTWARCWMLSDGAGNVLRQTSHDANIVVTRSGIAGTYLSTLAMQASSVRSSTDLGVDNLDIDALMDAAGVTEAKIRAGLFDNVRYTIFLVNWATPANSGIIVKSGIVGNIRTFARDLAQAEARGLKQLLHQTVVKTYSVGCRHDLGDAGCKVNLAPLTVTGTVTSVQVARRAFTAAGLAQAAGYFTGGFLTWTAGANNTYQREVKRHQAGGVIELFEPLPADIQVGDTFTLPPGCDHVHQVVHNDDDTTTVLGDCKPKFNNVLNYGGEPFIPGVNAVMRGI